MTFTTFRDYFIRNRYSIAVFVLLNIACAVCIGLVLARVAYSDSRRHIGLVWNLFLAWVPLWLAAAINLLAAVVIFRFDWLTS